MRNAAAIASVTSLLLALAGIALALSERTPRGVLVLLGFAVALAAAALISVRQHRRADLQALVDAEGGRAEAERRSHTDALTGLYNRRHVLDAIAAELARSDRTGVPPTVLMLDVDHFRRINAVYGHAAGDRVLVEIAARLQRRLRGYDVLGRWGGDEFIVLAPGVPDDETMRELAEQIRRLVGELPVAIDDVLLPVTVAAGAARAGDALRSVEGLVDCANRALAAARRRGSDRVQLFGDLTVRTSSPRSPSRYGWRARSRCRRPLARACRGSTPRRPRTSPSRSPCRWAARRGSPSAAASEDCSMTLAQLRSPIASSRWSARS